MDQNKIKDVSNFDELLDIKYGECDIQLSTLHKIYELGLGKRVNVLFG